MTGIIFGFAAALAIERGIGGPKLFPWQLWACVALATGAKVICGFF